MSVDNADRTQRPAATFESRAARFTTHWTPANVGIITVAGDLDASNATQFSDHVEHCAQHGDRLVLDLSELEFFGTAGFSALHTINVRCTDTKSRWVLVTGNAVSRLLRVCDPDGTLPIADSVPAAVTLLDGEPRRLLQLVAESS